MPYIRDKKWRQRGTGIKIADPRQDCFFSPENQGLVDVKHKQVVDRLLAHPNDFEVAWDLMGVHFDESGNQIENGSIIASGETASIIASKAISFTIPVFTQEQVVEKAKKGKSKKA